jgi:hypothetical protein
MDVSSRSNIPAFRCHVTIYIHTHAYRYISKFASTLAASELFPLISVDYFSVLSDTTLHSAERYNRKILVIKAVVA